ncbi:MAG: hypothetical protein HY661_10380 [Betaproteobacteria bacterium]|nr:hypothetical protein [Betaproteobacteria bacterium]
MDRRTFLAAGGTLALSACATPRLGNYESTEVPAPMWRAGDSWIFRRTDAFNGLQRGVVTRTLGPAGERSMVIVTRDETGRLLENALFESPGVQISGSLSGSELFSGTFTPRLRKYDFPLVSGKEWQQRLTLTDSNGTSSYIAAWSRVEGWEEVRWGVRNFHSMVVRRMLQLGPRPPYYAVLYREETEWVRAGVARTGAHAGLREVQAIARRV